MPKPDYDTSLARMAGNIAAGLVTNHGLDFYSEKDIAHTSVRIARHIVALLRQDAASETSEHGYGV